MAERVGFEPTVTFATPVFKTGAFDHSATSPGSTRSMPGVRMTESTCDVVPVLTSSEGKKRGVPQTRVLFQS